MELIYFFIIVLLATAAVVFYVLRRLINTSNTILVFLLSITGLLFLHGTSCYEQDYYQLADGIEIRYTPFASAHLITLSTFMILSFAAMILVWIKLRGLPPLILVSSVSFMIVGLVINSFIIIQVMRNTERVDGSILALLPAAYIITTLVIFKRILMAEAVASANRTYTYPLLNRLNNLMANTQWQPLWMILMALPVFLIVMLVLVTFGQAPDAIAKVFTDTTTWALSTKSHPPLIDHQGHYLCTVAACGDADIVKPIGWGKRHGYPILVNRQLQIANAFEELIQDKLPGLHRVIRSLYDKYGYPLSTKITSSKHSNLTYRLMKPLEYFFLLILYLFCLTPEQKIAKQYMGTL